MLKSLQELLQRPWQREREIPLLLPWLAQVPRLQDSFRAANVASCEYHPLPPEHGGGRTT